MNLKSGKCVILQYENHVFRTIEDVDPNWNLRWLEWRPDGKQFLAVGDAGLVVSYDGRHFHRIESGTSENLRCIACNSTNSSTLIVGNNGTILGLVDGKTRLVKSGSEENLRRVLWSADSRSALIVGNKGTTLLCDGAETREVQSMVTNNLRSIAWSVTNRCMFVSGNYFGESMVPSATLYRFSDVQNPRLEPVATTEKTDLTAIDCGVEPQQSLMAVGYDLVWQEPRAFTWNEGSMKAVRIDPSVPPYLTAIAWRPGQDYALVGTGSARPSNSGDRGTIFEFQASEGILGKKLYDMPNYRTVRIAWAPDQSGSALILGNRFAQTFST